MTRGWSHLAVALSYSASAHYTRYRRVLETSPLLTQSAWWFLKAENRCFFFKCSVWYVQGGACVSGPSDADDQRAAHVEGPSGHTQTRTGTATIHHLSAFATEGVHIPHCNKRCVHYTMTAAEKCIHRPSLQQEEVSIESRTSHRPAIFDISSLRCSMSMSL